MSEIETKIISQESEDKFWVKEINNELDQIEKNDTWDLVPRPKDKNVIDTKWVFKSKEIEEGKVIRNKVRLVGKGYE